MDDTYKKYHNNTICQIIILGNVFTILTLWISNQLICSQVKNVKTTEPDLSVQLLTEAVFSVKGTR
jgi:hypothetical protein